MEKVKEESKECFVIMPISDVDDHEGGHFGRVYEDIIRPALEGTGYSPLRADEVKATNLIHVDILNRLIAAPLAICDLSTRNPNVLFELGIRQAFDKPVVLIQEIGTPKVFDIAPLRYLEYSKEMKYRDVLETQNKLKEMINATMSKESKNSINSLVRLLSIGQSASVPVLDDSKRNVLSLDFLNSQMAELRDMVGTLIQTAERQKQNDVEARGPKDEGQISKLEASVDEVFTLLREGRISEEAARDRYEFLFHRVRRLSYIIPDKDVHERCSRLMSLIAARVSEISIGKDKKD